MEWRGFKQAIYLFAFFSWLCAYSQNDRIYDLLESVNVGKSLPEHSWIIDINRDTINVSSFRGKWLVIDYWSYGCKPCIEEFPTINRLYESVDHSKLEIINVFVGKDQNKWEKALKKYDINYPSFHGGWILHNPALAMNFQLTENKEIMTQTPQYVLIDPGGKIVNKALPKPSDQAFHMLLSNHIKDYK